jgi:hypothetical protein
VGIGTAFGNFCDRFFGQVADADGLRGRWFESHEVLQAQPRSVRAIRR